jgi:hypothetical protein
MQFLLLALITAVIGVVPLLFAKRIFVAVWMAGVSALVLWWLYWLVCPSFTWPLFGAVGLLILLLWIISAAFASVETDCDSDGQPWTWVFPIGGFAVFVV